jgi:hypothetical protein
VCAAVIATSVHVCSVSKSCVKEMGSEKWCVLIARLMAEYIGDQDVMTKICMMICNLCQASVKNQIQLGESGCCEAILGWMFCSNKNEGVILVCCHTLSMLFSLSKEFVMSRISKPEHFDGYGELLGQNLCNPKACRAVCALVAALSCEADSDGACNMASSNMCKIITKDFNGVLTAQPVDMDSCGVALCSIYQFLKKIESTKQIFREAGLVDCLKSSQTLHRSNEAMGRLIEKSIELLNV